MVGSITKLEETLEDKKKDVEELREDLVDLKKTHCDGVERLIIRHD